MGEEVRERGLMGSLVVMVGEEWVEDVVDVGMMRVDQWGFCFLSASGSNLSICILLADGQSLDLRRIVKDALQIKRLHETPSISFLQLLFFAANQNPNSPANQTSSTP